SIGAAIASVVAETVGAVFMLIYVHKKNLINLPQIFRLSIKNWLAAILMLITIKYVCNSIASSIFNLFFIIIFGVMIYFVILFILKDDFFISNVKLYTDKLLRSGKNKL
ncbi:MAG: polysaccharide biosynthesis C-terminal domain-containing protein, partial [Clostridiales bacterium]|nr:polysaccharide biosynthesis C-terminal domain-containing protein [Clostridiales bacterium]